MNLNTMNVCMAIIMVLTSLFMLFIWFLAWINKKKAPRPRRESIHEKRWLEEKRWKEGRCVNK